MTDWEVVVGLEAKHEYHPGLSWFTRVPTRFESASGGTSYDHWIGSGL